MTYTYDSILKLFQERLDLFKSGKITKMHPAILKDHPHAEMVPISEIEKFKEFDRQKGPHANPERVGELKSRISKDGGIHTPLEAKYGQKDKTISLVEGNHRLAAAKELGHTHVPLVITRHDGNANGPYNVKGVDADRHGYVPKTLKPSQVGLPVASEDKSKF